jgi:putative membrane protein
MGYWGDGHMDDGWGLAMLLGMLGVGLVIALAIGLGVVWAARSATAPAAAPAESMTGTTIRTATAGAEQILAERMARGEIDTAEYEVRLAALRTRNPSSPG